MSAPSPSKAAGFTLVEVLVAMFIFSIIVVGSTSALSGSIQSKAQVEQRLERAKRLNLSRVIISEDMSSIILRQNRDALGQYEPLLLSGGAENLLEFTRAGRQNPSGLQARGDLERVEYVYENQTLIRRALTHENPTQMTKSYDVTLLENLESADLQFLTKDGELSFYELRPEDDLELRAIKLEFQFSDGRSLTQYFEVNL